jgi:hypothetical protein
MNENIKKLIEQTDIYCDQHWLGNPFYEVKWEEKFAELIVKECAGLVEDYYDEDTKYLAGHIIRKHFGVK